MSVKSLLAFIEQNQHANIFRSGAGTMVRSATLLAKEKKNVVVVAKNTNELAAYRGLLSLFSSNESSQEQTPITPLWEKSFISLGQLPLSGTGKGNWAERMAALYALHFRQSIQIVVTTLDNFLFRLPPKDIFASHELRLYKGMEMVPELVVEQAVDWGYSRVTMVNTPGEVAVRGDIVDIFCPGYNHPFRLEFFGDTLDELRLFSPSSQRSVAEAEEVHILPVAPIVASSALLAEAKKFWEKEIVAERLTKTEAQVLYETAELHPTSLASGVFYPNSSCLEEWLPRGAVYLFPDMNVCLQEMLTLERSVELSLDDLANSKGLRQPKSLVLRSTSETQSFLKEQKTISFEEMHIGVEKDTSSGFSLPESTFSEFQAVFPDTEVLKRPWQHLVEVIKKWVTAATSGREVASESVLGKHLFHWFASTGEDYAHCKKLLLSFSSERSRKRFLKLAEQDGIYPKLRYEDEENGVFALISPFRLGLSIAWEHTLILGEDVIQPKAANTLPVPTKAFKGLDRYDSLEDGDFLVHRDYGVGVFGGLHRMQLNDIDSDYLLLLYANDDRLYLPVDRLALVQRYKGMDGATPTQDKLGGSVWAASRSKAKKAIEQIAADLVNMYALRKVLKGFNYAPIGEMYREFEATFGFETTPDQAKAIEEVLADMEKPEPMDRLVCGDVGFGKTEVALRAAFRAAAEGRQVALLCPTTILAEQHYQTFRSRLASFPVTVGLLSRFVPRAKQKEVLEASARGTIDILIGTHRLLSKDIVLPNLGLLILDEEQRFGVRHKERLKEMRKNVDALTLTATPIPRTLQLSLSGIRELSVIETAPPERKPVATALIDRDEDTLREILLRELARKGQVFWVYNRVQGLERVVEFIKKLVPDARVGMAHGQMAESVLEKTMRNFWVGEIDVLVCTSIIESGLDFPQANTLVVDQAHIFGLGQLYQLRGRVGRSDKQAYAVFVTPDLDKLSTIARQRMRIILEMDYLGAGFQVAMEDLRLRGAGNILGESQSGHMNRIGLDLFLEMLEEEVAKLKGQPLQSSMELELNIGVPALIPSEYIIEATERLHYYKQLSSAQDDAKQQDIELEMLDRFGGFPVELRNFSAILSFKRKMARIGAVKADITPAKIRLTFGEVNSLDLETIVSYVAESTIKEKAIKMLPPATFEIALHEKTSVKQALEKVEDMLHSFVLTETKTSDGNS